MRPYFPIIYVRGYAMTQREIEETVATPYMGFNLGSTKVRQNWQGEIERHIFESPLVRLMKDYDYRDCFVDGAESGSRLAARSVLIYRYYEPGSRELGEGRTPSVVEAALGLKTLIHKVRVQVCGEDLNALGQFRVYLVAHSMGGLVCRAFLQNDEVSTPGDRALVDKVFTYATPHNGIEMAGMNVPSFLAFYDMNNFNRKVMAGYLGLLRHDVVNTLDGKFDARRFFCLVGTNHRDYTVAGGLSSRLAGEMSDGLVRIENASVQGAPRAFVFRSHSGHYGIVNSEAGYQNLVRFLFGDVKVEAILEAEALPLPPSVRKAKEEGRKVRSSYYFEATVAPRGGGAYRLSERRKETFSAVLRGYDELCRPEPGKEPRSPMLFSLFLDTRRITVGRTLVFSLELAVSATGYEVDGLLWNDIEIPGEDLYKELITLRATPEQNGWRLRYNCTYSEWGESRGRNVEKDDQGWFIPLSTRKGFKGKLRLVMQPWQ